MKIVRIFEGRLYAIRHKGQRLDELRRLLSLWKDAPFVLDFLKQNKADLPPAKSVLQLTNIIAENVKTLNAILNDETKNLNEFFKPLNNMLQLGRFLLEMKGREQFLRIYALKIDDNCFIITGGAIKFTHFMEDRDHTKEELKKINLCRDYLNNLGVFDIDSFFELLNEQK